MIVALIGVLVVTLIGSSIGFLSSAGEVGRIDRTRILPTCVLILVVVFVLADLHPPVPLGGPVFAFSFLAGSALAEGFALRDHPLTEGWGYWSRVVFGIRHARLLREHARRSREAGHGGAAARPTDEP